MGDIFPPRRDGAVESCLGSWAWRRAAEGYAERLFKFPEIGKLNDQDARRAFSEPAEPEGAEFTAEALDRAVELTGGYPYFIQELGHAVWDVAEGTRITEADVERTLPMDESKLDASFFRVRLDRATDMQRAYLRAMASLRTSSPRPCPWIAPVCPVLPGVRDGQVLTGIGGPGIVMPESSRRRCCDPALG